MKNTYKYLCLFIALVGSLFIIQSCDNPFEGVTTILTNIKIDHSVNVQIVDANPDATNPYTTKPTVTLGGDAVDEGLIYSTDGKLLTTASGSATAVNNTVNLAVKPFTIISKSKPLRFFIKAEAANYISNTKEIVITSLDSLQFLKLPLLKISKLPEGVAVKTTNATAVAGELAKDFVVNVTSQVAGSSTIETVVTATFPASTVFFDVNNSIITTAGNFNISVIDYSAETPASISSLPGGIQASTTNDTDLSTIILAGAVDITASIGGKVIKSFDTPIPFEVKLAEGVFNPVSQTEIKVGDKVPVWSKDANSVVWKNEGEATIENDQAGGLKVTIQVSHLSTWMVGYLLPQCPNTTILKYESTTDEVVTARIDVNVKGGDNQLLASKTVTIKNGDEIELLLPQDVNFTVTVYDASSTSGIPYSTIDLAACATTGTITNTVVSTNPVLSFDLETRCPNGNFRYSGNIEYKLAGTALWLPFTPSKEGKLSTNLLEWDKIYDFRIIYRDVVYQRRRTVLKSEFTQVGNVWEYSARSFFLSPSRCN